MHASKSSVSSSPLTQLLNNHILINMRSPHPQQPPTSSSNSSSNKEKELKPKNVFDQLPFKALVHHADKNASISIAMSEDEHHTPQLNEGIKQIRSLIFDKKWMPDLFQPIPLPTLCLVEDKLEGQQMIFTLSDFILKQDSLAAKDAFQSAIDKDIESNGNIIAARKIPTREQLDELKEYGKLTVPSKFFSDQSHVWEVSGVFYLGKERNRARFSEGLGSTVDHFLFAGDAIVGCEEKHRWYDAPSFLSKQLGNFHCSVKSSFRDGIMKAIARFYQGIRTFLPWTNINRGDKYQPRGVSLVLNEAESLYIEHHLKDTLPGYIHQRQGTGTDTLYNSSMVSAWDDLRKYTECEKGYIPSNAKEECVRYSAASQTSSVINFTIWDKLALRRHEEIQMDQDRARLSPRDALRAKRKADTLWSNIKDDLFMEELQAMYESARSTTAGGYDCDFMQAEMVRNYLKMVECQLKREDKQAMEELEVQEKIRLLKRNSILSTSSLWLKRKLSIFRDTLQADRRKSFDSRVLERFGEVKDESEVTATIVKILECKLDFRRNEAPDIKKKLESTKLPPRTIRVTMPRLKPDEQGHMYSSKEISTAEPLWRTKYYGLKAYSICLNLSIGAMWYLRSGTLSLRALLCRDALDVTNRLGGRGQLQTLISRLQRFFRTLRQIREDFEHSQDLGLLGKSASRMLLRTYLGIRAVLGTIWITVFMVVGTIVMTSLSALTVALSPVLALSSVPLLAVFDILIYDFTLQQASPLFSILFAVPYTLLIPGICQTILALVLVFLNLSIGVFRLTLACFGFVIRGGKDSLVWPLLRRNVMIPVTDTFLARRIQGPGLGANYFCRMPLQSAFLAVQAHLDHARLKAYAKLRRIEISAPSEEFERMMHILVKPFGFHTNVQCRPEELSKTLIAEFQEFNYNTWESTSKTISSFEEDVFTWFEEKAAEECPEHRGTPYGLVSHTASLLLAKLHLVSSFRSQRLLAVCELPPNTRSKFRLPEDDMQLLWRSALSLTEQYASVISADLKSIVQSSPRKDIITPAANQLTNEFWTEHGGVRPGEDIEIVAARILSTIFGGEIMLEPLEEVDKRMILIQRVPGEDLLSDAIAPHLDLLNIRNLQAPKYKLMEEAQEEQGSTE